MDDTEIMIKAMRGVRAGLQVAEGFKSLSSGMGVGDGASLGATMRFALDGTRSLDIHITIAENRKG